MEYRKRKISDHVVNRLSGAGRGQGLKASLAPAGVGGRSNKTARVCVFLELSTFFNRLIRRNKSKCTNHVTMEVQFLTISCTCVFEFSRFRSVIQNTSLEHRYGKRFMDYMMEIFRRFAIKHKFLFF